MSKRQLILDSVPLDLAEVPQCKLNIEAKERSNPFPWNGQFSPQFVDALLKKYAADGTSVLDPFSGSGTVLHECARHGLPVLGIEVNPAAYTLSRTYALCNMRTNERENLIASVDEEIAKLTESDIFDVGFAPPSPQPQANFIARFVDGFRRFSGAERGLLETLVILSDIYKGINAAKLHKTWAKLRKIVRVLPYSRQPVRALLGDGRYPPSGEGFGLVFTSPPYINVYNYHQQYRASAEALGWDILEAARTEIGANRKNRGNRFLTVIQYCLDLAIALENLWDATKADARQIFVLGRESRICGVSFMNGELFSRLAVEAVGYRIALKQERVFTNRFGQQIFEDIIHIEKSARLQEPEMAARNIAADFLQDAYKICAQGTGEDIERAIEATATLNPSPRYTAANCHSGNHWSIEYGIPNATLGKIGGDLGQRQAAPVGQASGQ